MSSKIQTFKTDDGSVTLFDPTLNAHYRSTHGASTESTHVFVNGTRLPQRTSSWTVLELGLGGGMNLLQTLKTHKEQLTSGQLRYHTVDWNPVTAKHIRELAYETQGFEESHIALLMSLLEKAHNTPDASSVEIVSEDGSQHITLHIGAWEDIDVTALQADAVYHDPFGPKVNPESWSTPCFTWSFNAIAPHGILATYSAASHVRIAMVQAGYHIASTDGPGKKREITLASPDPDTLQGYKQLSRERYLAKGQAQDT